MLVAELSADHITEVNSGMARGGDEADDADVSVLASRSGHERRRVPPALWRSGDSAPSLEPFKIKVFSRIVITHNSTAHTEMPNSTVANKVGLAQGTIFAISEL